MGQAITSGPNQYLLARHLLQGDALAVFKKAAIAQTSIPQQLMKIQAPTS